MGGPERETSTTTTPEFPGSPNPTGSPNKTKPPIRTGPPEPTTKPGPGVSGAGKTGPKIAKSSSKSPATATRSPHLVIGVSVACVVVLAVVVAGVVYWLYKRKRRPEEYVKPVKLTKSDKEYLNLTPDGKTPDKFTGFESAIQTTRKKKRSQFPPP